MMAHQSHKERMKKPPRSYLPPRQDSLRSKSSLGPSSEFHLISPLSDLSDPSFSAFHRRSQGNAEEQESSLNRGVLVLENIPHPDRISTQRTHVLPNDAADIVDKKDKRKAITKAIKGYVTGGAHRLEVMRNQTTKVVRHTSTAVKNVVANGMKAKTTEEETLNIVVESRNEGYMQWAEKNNTLGLLNIPNDTSFEELWCETKGLQRDLTTNTPVRMLDTAFEDSHGLHREDTYFDRHATVKGSPCAKPSFSLMLKGLSKRNANVADPCVVDESVMSLYIDEPVEEGTEITGNALKKHDESSDHFHCSINEFNDAFEIKQRASASADSLPYRPDHAVESSIDEETKHVLFMEEFSMNQSIYQYSFVQPQPLSPAAISPMVDESILSVYVEDAAEEVTKLSGNAPKTHDESSDTMFHSSITTIKDAPESKQRPSSSADSLLYSPDHALKVSIAEESFQDNKYVLPLKDFSMNQSSYQNSFSQQESYTTYTSEDLSPVKLMSDFLALEDSRSVPEDSMSVLKNRGSESMNPEAPMEPLDPESSASRHETEDIVSIVCDTMSESPMTGLSEDSVSKVSLETEHHEPLNDITKETPTAALNNHHDRKVSLETMSLSSPRESEESSLGDPVFTLSDTTTKSTTVTFSDHQDRKVSFETMSSSLPQKSEHIASTATAMTHKEPISELSEDSVEYKAPRSRHEVNDLALGATDSEMSRDEPKVQETHTTKEVAEKRHRKNSVSKILRGKMTKVIPKKTVTRGKKDIKCETKTTKHEPTASVEQLRNSNLASQSTDEADAESFPSEFMSLKVTESAPSLLEETVTRGKKDIKCETKTTKHEPTGTVEQLRHSNLASRSTDDADTESFSSEFMSLKVTESAPSLLETVDFRPEVHFSPEIVKRRERKSNVVLESSSKDSRMIATPARDQNKKVVIDVSELDASFLAPVPYSPSADSVASSVGSSIPLISNQALSNAAFLFSPSYAGGEIKLLPQANSPRPMNLSTFAINTAESRGRLSTFSARSRPAFSIPISSAPDNMSSIRASRSSYSDDDITYRRPENGPSNDDGIQKHVHFSNSNDVFVIRESNKARVAMGTPLKVVSPVIENKVDKGISPATSPATGPSPPVSRGSLEKRSSTTIDLDRLHEVKAGADNLDREDGSGVESQAQETSSKRKEGSSHGLEASDGDPDHHQDGVSIDQDDGKNDLSWSYREENGVLCAATPLRTTGRPVQHRPSLAVPANSPTIRFRQARIKFSSKPVEKVYIRKAPSTKFPKPSVNGTVHSRVTELNGRLKSNRQLVRKTSRRATGGENVLAPRPATLNPAIMSYQDITKSGSKYSIESQSSYEGMSDTGVSTVVSGIDEAERKEKYSIESLSLYEERSNTGIIMVSSSEDEAEHKPNYCIESSTCEGRSDTGVSTVAASDDDEVCHVDVSAIGVEKDIFAKMMGSPEESSFLSDDEDDAFAEIMKKSSPSFDDHRVKPPAGRTLQLLLSEYEDKSSNQQHTRPSLSRGPIGTSLRSLVSEDPSALTFDTHRENSRLGPQTLSFTDKAKVNPREQQHCAPNGALCLSPLQRTPMQARKWRTLAAAAKEKDLTKKGSSKKQSGLRERSTNVIY